jgi:hypothetical protein
MNVFKTFKLLWWQTGLFKLCLLSIGILFGLYFRDFFLNLIPALLILAVASGVYIAYIWYKQK